ncbi:MAG TPA: tRNA (N(6)-L-threonylcarbamoyladenosine(37)-C(2))-methylthiotransferase MtaB [Alphaproteobacteria bacterium]|jgi:threonylcarbamoyladenosine tRNA methylthiotransferase MtaB|nr:MAG: tRNA (N(6)-L-threonylcarbamoyladenosine(37)-C(2))-methylthiotransferase MtaB [SAR116 cluster bacterium MED-G05]HAO56618.1 tRNA (N(6)-L-threonylcarbamoyladenosine(37)-C(2))-methylthiotransferase MtaB [Alphaproteobacteria bacterium]HBD52238.1 tRNA (N(6)-L-threonylcarbamoyladenosine(37)-C(2))-methylthiotransferase MtaB [Alphaproteobacteria bacterium]HBP60033.1 tRNA (N(6)-L-threonylcarbamoyladenosine(37)-C(2))-methylthiotransferase MtaB [Alphaproteobacteria bacterium]HBP72336.1 tRNA (N(6)-L|tara:strand:- start:278 stop:1543 length:1266 start_codon:yes stop_codon:yes gene_type:complete
MAERNAPHVETFGCRLNIWESEVVRDHAGNAGLNNAIIFNTCAVTAEAERQARQAIRRARRDNPDAQIVVTGCAAQIAPDSWSSMAEVDHVIGNHDKLSQAAWMSVAEGCEAIIVSDVMAVREMATHMMDGFHAHTRGFLQIQQGCDHRCTFCIIPYGRGNNRSAGLTQIIDAAQLLVDGGSVEVVLTGVDITSWGSDLPGRPRLGDLVQALLSRVSGLQRLRLSSIDPAEPDARLMAVLGDDDRLMPHLHLSAQHGDDLVLKQMKRRHLARDVIRFCDEARRRRPDIVFGADIIAGFPTETEDAHNATRQMIRRAGITYLHVFPFSPRTGTPAARMRQIDGDTIRRRARELREDGTIRMQQFLDNAVGSLDQMLVEGGNSGHGRNYAKMRLQGDFIDRGALLDVKINGRDDDILIVEQIG